MSGPLSVATATRKPSGERATPTTPKPMRTPLSRGHSVRGLSCTSLVADPEPTTPSVGDAVAAGVTARAIAQTTVALIGPRLVTYIENTNASTRVRQRPLA